MAGIDYSGDLLPPWPKDRKNWCWALVTTAVLRHYARRRGGRDKSVEPCAVVARVLKRADACTTPGSHDVPAVLADALEHQKHRSKTLSRSISTAEAVAELSQGRPVGIGVRWAGDPVGAVGHFAMIVEADEVSDEIVVWDPEKGIYRKPRLTFVTDYPGGGTWESTYFTTPQKLRPPPR